MPKAAQFLPSAAALKKDAGTGLEVCQCSGCGLVQLSNEPVPYYREVVRASAFSPEMRDFRVKQFSRFVRKYALKGGKVIEIGCGRGEYLSLMRRTGADVYGLEYSGKAVDHCRREGLKVSRGFLGNSHAKLRGGPFQAFFILSFLEHLPEPNSTLREAYNNLSDGGYGLVEVPNFDMIMRKNLFSEFISDHLLYFTKDTLVAALDRNGFEVLECKEIWRDYIISAVVRKRGKLDLSRFHRRRTALAVEINAYIRRFKPGKVAVWGAGHQALTVMSLASLAGKIRYVVDSAPFKQGKYTPATHIPIVSPASIVTDPVDAVIVMAAGYSDEVAGIIRRKYDGKINISILRERGLETV